MGSFLSSAVDADAHFLPHPEAKAKGEPAGQTPVAEVGDRWLRGNGAVQPAGDNLVTPFGFESGDGVIERPADGRVTLVRLQ